MSMSDPIADMLTRIRNAQLVEKLSILIPSSKIKIAISEVLKNEGYIKDFNIQKEDKKIYINILLKYYSGRPVIEYIKRVSKPGLRVYSRYSKIKKIMNGFGIAIISTSKGVITDRQARFDGIGGEIICYVA